MVSIKLADLPIRKVGDMRVFETSSNPSSSTKAASDPTSALARTGSGENTARSISPMTSGTSKHHKKSLKSSPDDVIISLLGDGGQGRQRLLEMRAQSVARAVRDKASDSRPCAPTAHPFYFTVIIQLMRRFPFCPHLLSRACSLSQAKQKASYLALPSQRISHFLLGSQETQPTKTFKDPDTAKEADGGNLSFLTSSGDSSFQSVGGGHKSGSKKVRSKEKGSKEPAGSKEPRALEKSRQLATLDPLKRQQQMARADGHDGHEKISQIMFRTYRRPKRLISKS
ncbi:hypothetical protein COOONC_22192 [Cooperia oncophora]